MEYIIPIVLTFCIVYTILILSSKQRGKYFNSIMYSQSSIHSRIRHLFPIDNNDKNKIESQADKHINKNMIKIIVVEGVAYWIAENIFYTAEVENGNIISDTVKQIDTSEMSKDELDKMLKILDNLNSGG